MDAAEAAIELWNRQCRILSSVCTRINESNRKLKSSLDGMTLDAHLAHIHKVRTEWLSKLDPQRASTLGELFVDGWTTPINDLYKMKQELSKSGQAVGEAVHDHLTAGTQGLGGYDHPVLFLGHMVWHEGWHVGLVFLALRLAGQEPAAEWEEEHVWGEWRVEEW